MITRKDWTEFRKSGLLWFVNRSLHIFGWAIVFQIEENGKVSDVYPARVKFRGFDEKSESESFIQISELMVKTSEELLKEAKE